jgi:diaminopimelate decarboxylase
MDGIGGRLTPEAIALRVADFLARMGPIETAVLVHDLDAVDVRLADLRAAVPDALHALAVKAQPLVAVLRHVVDRGFGLECASAEEVALARAAGCPPDAIVFDGPARTRPELAEALADGVRLNLDRLEEIERVAALRPSGHPPVGIRVDPGVGEGRIAATSTSGPRSKFGVPLWTDRAAVVAAFVRHPWLRGLHVHVGSAGVSVDQLLAGARGVVALSEEIERAGGHVEVIDVGGGFPVAYRPGEAEFDVAAWGRGLRDLGLPGGRRLITEPGRWVHAGAGFAVSRVEAVKRLGDARCAVLHIGADLLPRRALLPEVWFHDVVVLGPDGCLKQAPEEPHALAGPLCFSGDLLARDMVLPRVDEGDLVAIRDTGAYALGMWSRHCSRAIPAVWGRSGGVWNLLRRRETLDDIVSFWS